LRICRLKCKCKKKNSESHGMGVDCQATICQPLAPLTQTSV
jgi:hypothetical protein